MTGFAGFPVLAPGGYADNMAMAAVILRSLRTSINSECISRHRELYKDRYLALVKKSTDIGPEGRNNIEVQRRGLDFERKII